MIGYRDRTFCDGNGGKCEAFQGCPRALTATVKADAERWWGKPDPPITQFSEPQKLECYEPPKNDE